MFCDVCGRRNPTRASERPLASSRAGAPALDGKSSSVGAADGKSSRAVSAAGPWTCICTMQWPALRSTCGVCGNANPNAKPKGILKKSAKVAPGAMPKAVPRDRIVGFGSSFAGSQGLSGASRLAERTMSKADRDRRVAHLREIYSTFSRDYAIAALRAGGWTVEGAIDALSCGLLPRSLKGVDPSTYKEQAGAGDGKISVADGKVFKSGGSEAGGAAGGQAVAREVRKGSDGKAVPKATAVDRSAAASVVDDTASTRSPGNAPQSNASGTGDATATDEVPAAREAKPADGSDAGEQRR